MYKYEKYDNLLYSKNKDWSNRSDTEHYNDVSGKHWILCEFASIRNENKYVGIRIIKKYDKI